MSSKKELVVSDQETFDPVPLGKQLTSNSVQMAQTVGRIAYLSGLAGVPKEEAAIFKILTGFEIGLPMMSSLKYIYAIKTGQGTTLSVAPKAVLALVYNSKLVENFEIVDLIDENDQPVGCTVSGNRIGQKPYEVTFTINDAKRAGIYRAGGAWEAYPANMCRWRALGFWCDVVVPDLGLGLMRTTDLTDQVDSEGIPTDSVVDAEFAAESVSSREQELVSKIISLTDLIQSYTPQEILDANEGVMPRPDEDLTALAKKLSGDVAS